MVISNNVDSGKSGDDPLLEKINNMEATSLNAYKTSDEYESLLSVEPPTAPPGADACSGLTEAACPYEDSLDYYDSLDTDLDRVKYLSDLVAKTARVMSMSAAAMSQMRQGTARAAWSSRQAALAAQRMIDRLNGDCGTTQNNNDNCAINNNFEDGGDNVLAAYDSCLHDDDEDQTNSSDDDSSSDSTNDDSNDRLVCDVNDSSSDYESDDYATDEDDLSRLIASDNGIEVNSDASDSNDSESNDSDSDHESDRDADSCKDKIETSFVL